MHTQKGQVIVAVLGVVSSVILGVFSYIGTAKSEINKIDTKVQIVEERENNHYLELSKQMTEINTKLDKLIDNQISKNAVKK